MRKPTFLIPLLLPLFTFSQVNIINRSLTDSTLKIVYSGVDNIIEVNSFAFTNTTRIGISNAEFIPLDKNKIKIIPKYGFKECMVSIENLHTDSKEFKQVFRIDTLIGDLKIRPAGIRDSIATILQILINPFLISEIPGTYYKSPVYISSFNLTFIGRNFDSLRTYALDNLFTKEQIDLVKRLLPGDGILFEVYFFWPNSRRRKYPPFVILIK